MLYENCESVLSELGRAPTITQEFRVKIASNTILPPLKLRTPKIHIVPKHLGVSR